MVILTDFDGTITTRDVLDEILERFADKKWLELEKKWLAGEIGSKECLLQQAALVSVTSDQLEELLNSIKIDPDFPAFLQYCFTQEIPIRIVSDNFQWFIRHILRNSLPNFSHILDRIPIYCNEVKLTGAGLEYTFPYSGGECTHGCATCKAGVVKKVRAAEKDEIIFIGDGMSDLYGAREADVVFGKGVLLDYCRKESLNVMPFDRFSVIQKWIEDKRKATAQTWPQQK